MKGKIVVTKQTAIQLIGGNGILTLAVEMALHQNNVQKL